MRGAVLCHFWAKMPYFHPFLTEYCPNLPLFVLTENSLVAEVVEHHPIDLAWASQASKYLGWTWAGQFSVIFEQKWPFLVIFDRIFFRSATFCSDRELPSCRSCRAPSNAPWVNFSGSQVLLMTMTPAILCQMWAKRPKHWMGWGRGGTWARDSSKLPGMKHLMHSWIKNKKSDSLWCLLGAAVRKVYARCLFSVFFWQKMAPVTHFLFWPRTPSMQKL